MVSSNALAVRTFDALPHRAGFAWNARTPVSESVVHESFWTGPGNDISQRDAAGQQTQRNNKRLHQFVLFRGETHRRKCELQHSLGARRLIRDGLQMRVDSPASWSRFFNMKSIVLCLLLATPCSTDAPEGPVDAGRRESDVGSSGVTEYGRGEYAIFLSEPPGRYCWHLAEHRRVCPGDDFVRRSVSHECTDDLLACRETEPENSETDGYCFESITWRTVGGEALHGSCEAHADYWGDTRVNCLYHRHCRSNFQDAAVCVDYRCQCGALDCEDQPDAGVTADADAGDPPLPPGP